MMLPCLGLLRGTHTMTRVPSPPALARSLTVSSSCAPASVSLATTRMVLMSCSPSSLGGRLGVGTRWGCLCLGRRGRFEDAVDRARAAVLVRPADHRRQLIEVEHRRRGGDL